MSSRFPVHRRSAGFSLAEVLVALAIAAMMTAVLVRFIAGTRVHAARVSEALEMGAVADTLLSRVTSGRDLRPGRTDGRAGSFAWRIDIQPIAFRPIPRRLQKRQQSVADADAPRDAKTRAAGKPMNADAEESQSRTPAGNWFAYRVSVAVEAPSGRKHVADSVRVGPSPEAMQR